MKFKFDHRRADTEAGSRIVDYDTCTANEAIDFLVSGAKESIDGDGEIAEQQREFGSQARKIVTAGLGNPTAEMAYYSTYLLPRILANLGRSDFTEQDIAGTRAIIGSRVEAVLAERKRDLGSLWQLYKSFFVEGNVLRKKLHEGGLDELIVSEKRQSDAKKIKKYSPEFMNVMLRSAAASGVDFRELVGGYTKDIMASYGEHSETSDLVFDPQSYVLEMMRLYFEKSGYLDEFADVDEKFFDTFLDLRQKIEGLLDVIGNDDEAKIDDHILEVMRTTLSTIAILTKFYSDHAIHSSVVMNAKYPLSEEMLAAGIASIKWHVMLAHFILTQRKLLKP